MTPNTLNFSKKQPKKMKKTILTTIILTAAASSLFANGLVYTDLVSLTSADWTIDTDNSSGPYSQTNNDGLVWNGSVGQTSIASGLFVQQFDWSAYGFNDFAVRISGSSAKGFDITLGDTGSGLLTLTGSANSADGNGYVPLSYGSDNGFNLSQVTSYTWTWSDPSSAVSISNSSFAAVSAVPEPSTYALMAIGAVGLFLAARRRKAQA